MTVVTLMHNKIELALHQLKDGSSDEPALLLLHGLGQETGSSIPGPWSTWPGAKPTSA